MSRLASWHAPALGPSLAQCSRHLHAAGPLRNRICSVRRLSIVTHASSAPVRAKTLNLHIGETTISIPFTREQGKQLETSFAALMQTFSAKAKTERPKRYDIMEVKFKGEAEKGEVEYMEVMCNPNACATVVDAKLLVTLRTRDGVKVLTEGRFSNIKNDLDEFMAAP